MPIPTLLQRIRNIEGQERIMKIVKDIRNIFNETLSKGILFRITETISSMVLATVSVKATRPHDIRAIYFIENRRYKMPIDLNRLLDYLGITYEYIEIGSITKTIENYISGYTQIEIENIRESMIAMILRELSDKYDLLLLGETDKTLWLTGTFNPIYTKTMDLLPLTHVYTSQLRKLASELHIMPYIRRTREHLFWRKFKEEIEINNNEVIDAVIYGIERNKTDMEIYQDLKEETSIKTIRKIRMTIESRYIKRNGPLVA